MNLDNLNVTEVDMNKVITKWFEQLLTNEHMSPSDALDYLNYQIFVRNSVWFFELPENKQEEIRFILHSIRLVHKNF